MPPPPSKSPLAREGGGGEGIYFFKKIFFKDKSRNISKIVSVTADRPPCRRAPGEPSPAAARRQFQQWLLHRRLADWLDGWRHSYCARSILLGDILRRGGREWLLVIVLVRVWEGEGGKGVAEVKKWLSWQVPVANFYSLFAKYLWFSQKFWCYVSYLLLKKWFHVDLYVFYSSITRIWFWKCQCRKNVLFLSVEKEGIRGRGVLFDEI